MKRRSLLKAMALLPALPLLGHAPLSLAQAIANSVTPLDKPLNQEKRDGTYICAACYLPLFASQDKYESGTGWPSFTQPIAGHMGQKRDFKLFFPRTEYHCARCGGHQGHVFDDGPKPRGERWCNNGVALRFIAASESLPELRS